MNSKLLFGIVIVGVLLIGASPAFAEECQTQSVREQTCSATATTDEVILTVTDTTPGSNPHAGDLSGGEGDDDTATSAPQPFRDPFFITTLPTITLADIAAFRPDPAVDHSEPNGWTIAGLDTNFYATGGAGIKNGTLLGLPASVRFTPVTWRWAYGDGASASKGTAGAAWVAQGIHEFDATATSHVYEEYGRYTIDLDVDYVAEYRFAGGPWLGINGVLSVPANRLVISVGDAKTVLVERDCAGNPGGPGC